MSVCASKSAVVPEFRKLKICREKSRHAFYYILLVSFIGLSVKAYPVKCDRRVRLLVVVTETGRSPAAVQARLPRKLPVLSAFLSQNKD